MTNTLIGYARCSTDKQDLSAQRRVLIELGVTQLESYAFAVAGDQRFKSVPAKWIFWAISSDLDLYAERRANQSNLPRGVAYARAGS